MKQPVIDPSDHESSDETGASSRPSVLVGKPVPEPSRDTDSVDRPSRRRFAGTAVAIPAILSLVSRPAVAQVCPASAAFSSANPSGAIATTSVSCTQMRGGISPGGWRNPDVGRGNSDGNRNQWYQAGFNPNPRNDKDPGGSSFNNAFRYNRFAPDVTMHDVLNNMPGSLEFHAVAALLNASLPIPGYLAPHDVRGLYIAAASGTTYVTSGGSEIFLTANELKNFFDQTYH